MFCQRN